MSGVVVFAVSCGQETSAREAAYGIALAHERYQPDEVVAQACGGTGGL